ncbi:hypothetical protein NDU88_002051 [Pleurodeles waltl]|uniref:Uncharacterized protein n=1 Tax=Pleurodeles waltl TaxID=8319 RepID=A0AAV7LD40_PLEWA|nr:hypothetical protein NDU88_002051 [Pleurodeles waltl]
MHQTAVRTAVGHPLYVSVPPLRAGKHNFRRPPIATAIRSDALNCWADPKGKQFEDVETPTPDGLTPVSSAKGHADKLDVILQEIKDSRLAIERKLGSITSELSMLVEDQKKLSDRKKQTETSIAGILPTHRENKSAIELLQQQVEVLQERVEDAEGWTQHNI